MALFEYMSPNIQITPSIAFPNTALKSFDKVLMFSCDLGFDISQSSNAKNFGTLIGRDIMARWNIFWNGPTSSVFIADEHDNFSWPYWLFMPYLCGFIFSNL